MAEASHDHESVGASFQPQAPEQREAERTPVQSMVGNRAFGQAIARMGAGILPGGAVHPAVAAAIGAARGAGHGLPEPLRAEVGERMSDPLGDVRIHTDSRAAELARSVSARAFTTGTDVFFGAGEYQPSSRDGKELLAHELTHVVQQRGAPTTGPMTVSEPGESIEVEAEQVARDVAR